MGRVTAEPGSQGWILRGDSDRTRVQMTNAHHDATQSHEWCGCKSKFFGSQQRCNNYIASGFELAVCLNGDAAAEVVEQQRLVGFSEAELPWHTRMLDAGEWRGAGAAVVTANQHYIGVCFGNARRNRADSNLGNQLDADPRLVVGALEIVNQFGEVFDGID